MILRKSIIVFLCALSFGIYSSKVYAQKLHIELKSITTNKVRKLVENDSVVVHTAYRKYKGRLKIIDKKMISINGNNIKIDDIIKIESKNLKGKL